VLAALIGVVVSAVALELALRAVLFVDMPVLPGAFHRLRHARNYADWQNDEDYWKLAFRLGEMSPLPPSLLNRDLGWVSEALDRESLRHHDEGEIRGRRPILLYGDSYAHCMTDGADCFQGLLARSELAADYCLLNFGVCGYGIDQVDLLLTRTIDRFAGERPIVIVGIFVDDDIDRAAMRLRYSTKPCFDVREGRIVPDSSAVPLFGPYVAEHPIEIRSYAWRWLLHSGCLPRSLVARLDDSERRGRTQALGRSILADIEEKLASRGVEHFYLLFHGEPRVASDAAADWRDDLVLDFLHRSNARYVSASAYLRAVAHDRGAIAELFGRAGPVLDHYLPRANEIVLGAVRDGIAGKFEPLGSAAIELAPR
jgi:hypothetical protein